MDIAILCVLILLNGMFAMSELGLVTARKSRLEQASEQGDKAAGAALKLGETPTRFLSTIQIGITAIGLLSGIFGESALAAPFAVFLQELGLSRAAGSAVSTGVVVAGITFFSIVFGELVPKRLAQLNPENVARLAARPISLLARLTSPFVWLLSASTDGVLAVLGKKDSGNSNLTEEDIRSVLAEGAQSGAIEPQEHELVRNVFRLDDRLIASLMTPRNEIVWLNVDDPDEENLQKVIDAGRSRFPVCRGGLDTILGIVSAKDLLVKCARHAPIDLLEQLQPAVYVPESLTGIKLLDHFRESGVQLVFVVDEYGNVVGIVTLQDVLVALAGEFTPADPEDVWAVRRQDGSWLLDGMIPVLELKDRLELRSLPEEDKAQYNTLAGMLLWLTGSIPHIGNIVVWENWSFEIIDLDGNRIDKVLATPQP